MAFILNVLNVTGIAVGRVGTKHDVLSLTINFSIVALRAGHSGRLYVEVRAESLVATRTGHLAGFVGRHSIDRADAVHVQRMKLRRT